MSYECCTEVKKDKKIVLKDKGSKCQFEILNPGGIKVYSTRVDGCLIKGHIEKCDFLVRTDCPERVARLVELKGKKIDKAISQLETTLKSLPKEVEGYKIECYAVTTSTPKGRVSNIKRKLEFKRKNSSDLFLKNIRFSISVS